MGGLLGSCRYLRSYFTRSSPIRQHIGLRVQALECFSIMALRIGIGECVIGFDALVRSMISAAGSPHCAIQSSPNYTYVHSLLSLIPHGIVFAGYYQKNCLHIFGSYDIHCSRPVKSRSLCETSSVSTRRCEAVRRLTHKE